jgi:hypothetical protein
MRESCTSGSAWGPGWATTRAYQPEYLQSNPTRYLDWSGTKGIRYSVKYTGHRIIHYDKVEDYDRKWNKGKKTKSSAITWVVADKTDMRIVTRDKPDQEGHRCCVIWVGLEWHIEIHIPTELAIRGVDKEDLELSREVSKQIWREDVRDKKVMDMSLADFYYNYVTLDYGAYLAHEMCHVKQMRSVAKSALKKGMAEWNRPAPAGAPMEGPWGHDALRCHATMEQAKKDLQQRLLARARPPKPANVYDLVQKLPHSFVVDAMAQKWRRFEKEGFKKGHGFERDAAEAERNYMNKKYGKGAADVFVIVGLAALALLKRKRLTGVHKTRAKS